MYIFSEKREKAEPPSFLKKINDTEVYDGMSAKFTACATGYPQPDVEWYKNGMKLTPSDKYKMESERNGLLRLIIDRVHDGDTGKYSCKIINAHGQDICHAELTYDCKFIKKIQIETIFLSIKQYMNFSSRFTQTSKG